MRMLERRRRSGLPMSRCRCPRTSRLRGAPKSRRAAPRTAGGAVRDAIGAAAAPSVLLTSPRPGSGPIAIAKVHVVEPLAAEPPPGSGGRSSEVIERAAGPSARVAPCPGSTRRRCRCVLSRARALAGGDLDVELAALRERPRRRSRSRSRRHRRSSRASSVATRSRQRWAPPPAVATKPEPPCVSAAAAAIAAAPVRACRDSSRRPTSSRIDAVSRGRRGGLSPGAHERRASRRDRACRTDDDARARPRR